jgi:hypothetical protein
LCKKSCATVPCPERISLPIGTGGEPQALWDEGIQPHHFLPFHCCSGTGHTCKYRCFKQGVYAYIVVIISQRSPHFEVAFGKLVKSLENLQAGRAGHIAHCPLKRANCPLISLSKDQRCVTLLNINGQLLTCSSLSAYNF